MEDTLDPSTAPPVSWEEGAKTEVWTPRQGAPGQVGSVGLAVLQIQGPGPGGGVASGVGHRSSWCPWRMQSQGRGEVKMLWPRG